jgi:hypothetical protein
MSCVDTKREEKMAPITGAIFDLIVMTMTMLDHNDLLAMAAMPAAVCMMMPAAVYVVVAVPALDDHCLRRCKRRQRDGKSGNGCNGQSNFLHA